MQITVLSATKQQATSKAGKPYSFIELAYKGEDGAVKGKKVMPFGESKPVHDALALAQGGEAYNITAVKNEGTGYWDWVAASKSDGSIQQAPQAGGTRTAAPAAGGKVTGSNYETPEERAKKQVYIVRQSSITAALTFLGGKAKSTDEVIKIAKEIEAYVFSSGTIDPPAAIPKSLDDFPDDVPL